MLESWNPFKLPPLPVSCQPSRPKWSCNLHRIKAETEITPVHEVHTFRLPKCNASPPTHSDHFIGEELPPRIFGRYGSRRPLGCDQLPWDRNSRDKMGQDRTRATFDTNPRSRPHHSPSKSYCHDQDTAPPPSVRLRLRFRRRPRLPGNSIHGHAVLCHA